MTAKSPHLTKAKNFKLISIVLKPTPKLPRFYISKSFYTLVTSSPVPGWVPRKDGSRNHFFSPLMHPLHVELGAKLGSADGLPHPLKDLAFSIY